MKTAKLNDHLFWEGKPAKVIAEVPQGSIIIEMDEPTKCKHCGEGNFKHQFSVIPSSPLFQENAQPIQTISS